MGDVVVLPGIERRDLAGPPVAAERVLTRTIEKGVTDVVIVGRHRDGSRYVAASFCDMDKTVGVLMDGVAFLTNCGFRQGIADDGEPE